jgi:hypothetical protein
VCALKTRAESRERWSERTHTEQALLAAVGGNATAVTIVRFLASQPDPLCYLATPREGLTLANGELIGMTVDDIQWAIASAGMQLGELRSVGPEDAVGIDRLSKMVGVYVTNQKRFGQRGDDRAPNIPAHLITAFLKHWCAEYKRFFKREYSPDDADREGAARLIGRGRHAAMVEAEDNGEVISGEALDERAREYVKHWIPFYFREEPEWIRVDMFKLKHMWKRVSPYGRPPRVRMAPLAKITPAAPRAGAVTDPLLVAAAAAEVATASATVVPILRKKSS